MQGRFKGFDQATNVILEKCYERVFSKDNGVDQVPLGLYVIRGDNMSVHVPWYVRELMPLQRGRR